MSSKAYNDDMEFPLVEHLQAREPEAPAGHDHRAYGLAAEVRAVEEGHNARVLPDGSVLVKAESGPGSYPVARWGPPTAAPAPGAAPAGPASTAGACPSPASTPPWPPAASSARASPAGTTAAGGSANAPRPAAPGCCSPAPSAAPPEPPPGRRSGCGPGGDQGEDVVGGDLLAVLVVDGDVPADLAVGLALPGGL